MGALDSMDHIMRKHPLVSAAAVLGMIWWFTRSKTASAQPSPAPSPGPSPAPPSPPVPPAATLVPITRMPGASTITIADGGSFILILPTGAHWPQVAPGTTPVVQAPGSVLGGTVDPLVPTEGGIESQTWSNVTGNGTLWIAWLDNQNVPQMTTLTVATVGGSHGLGG